MILDIEELKRLRKAEHYSYKRLSEESGVPIGTVQKVFGDITRSPRRDTLEALSKVLAPQRQLYSFDTSGAGSSMVCETEHAYSDHGDPDLMEDKVERLLASKKSGGFTVNDYFIISEKYRIELIDGEIYDMASPTFDHQHIAGLVYTQMMNFRMANNEDCIPVIAPIDVQLDCDDKTMVQPDLIVLCDKKKNLNEKIFGAPDFVMEVFSPSTRSKDKVKKRDKYRDAGCREYWMVDPFNERVTVLDFENGLDGLYTFDQTIPVRISGGLCQIDFAIIKKELTLW